MMTNPINSPENSSPSGIREIGIGPNEYRMPIRKDKPPSRNTSSPVSATSAIPPPTASASRTAITATTVLSFSL
ncbi:hypothetical protein D3C87_1921120 [compost metagenome]